MIDRNSFQNDWICFCEWRLQIENDQAFINEIEEKKSACSQGKANALARIVNKKNKTRRLYVHETATCQACICNINNCFFLVTLCAAQKSGYHCRVYEPHCISRMVLCECLNIDWWQPLTSIIHRFFVVLIDYLTSFWSHDAINFVVKSLDVVSIGHQNIQSSMYKWTVHLTLSFAVDYLFCEKITFIPCKIQRMGSRALSNHWPLIRFLVRSKFCYCR